VASGRKLEPAKVLAIAKGRIWTGEDAVGLGLVDALGGFDVALKLAKEAAKIPAGDDVNLVVFPKKKSFFEALTQKAPDSSERDAWAKVAVELTTELRPVLRVLRELGLTQDVPGVLTMPPVRPRN